MSTFGPVTGGSLPVIITPTVSTGKNQMQSTSRNDNRQPNYAVIMIIGFISLMALTAVPLVMLYQRVRFLEQQHGLQSSQPFSDYLYNLNSNGTDELQHRGQQQNQYHHSLWRRDAHDDDTNTIAPFNYLGTNGGQLSSMIHVAGSQYDTYGNNDWITWMDVDGPGSLSIEHMPFIQNKFIIIPRSGYYFVYAQLTYRDNLTQFRYTIGHDVIREPNCGNGDVQEQAIMKSYVTQIEMNGNARAHDSTYVGGVFYLSQNDRIGVRTKLEGASSFTIFNDSQPLCFFGAYILSHDSAFDSRLEDDCCCLGS